MADTNEQHKPGDEVSPDTPQSGDDVCERCGGTGRMDEATCPECAGTGTGTVTVSVGDA